MKHQTAEFVSHCDLVTDFKSMLKYGDWSTYTFVATELSNLCIKGRAAISPSYDVSWSLDEVHRLKDPQSGVSRVAKMRVNIGGTRLALELKPNRDGIAVWRLVE